MIVGSAVPPPPPTWVSETPLSQPRAYAQAVGLATGEVLLVGGMGRDDGLVMRTEAELFDPLTRRSVLVGGVRPGRIWHTVTTLADDRVLVAGGVERAGDGWSTLGLAEIFDPWTRRWTRVAEMLQPRSDHAATLLKDGRVLVAGGHVGPTPLASVEIYDPATDTWTAAAPLTKTRWSFSMATLPDGRVLAAGGFMDPGLQTDTSVIYDPATDTWTEGPRLWSERANHTTVLLPSGDVLLVGGQRAAANTAERYDARLGAFVFAGTLVQPRMFAQAAARPDGSVVLVGGILRPESGEGFVPNDFVEIWDPRTNLWSAYQSAPTARAAGAAVAVGNGVCIFGGSILGDEPIRTVECLE